MKSTNSKKFDTIVRQYKAMRNKYPDQHVDYCIQQKTLADAIEVSAKAINDQNKIHNHQRRVGRANLNFFAGQLKLKEVEIKRSKTFDELLSTIEAVKCDRIAELTHYDTATRIGAYLDLFPDRIYLHTGTKIGAKYLLGDLKGRKFITIDELPKDFLKFDLTASEFEDILCIFKDDFKQPFILAWRNEGRPC
jgi:hypothetical protein